MHCIRCFCKLQFTRTKTENSVQHEKFMFSETKALQKFDYRLRLALSSKTSAELLITNYIQNLLA